MINKMSCSKCFAKKMGSAAILMISYASLSLSLGCSGSSGPGFPVTLAGVGTGVGGAGRGPSPVPLGGAGSFTILAQSAITDIPTSAVTGDVGLSPATGAGISVSCVEVTGAIYSVDAAGPACKVTSPASLTIAINDKNTAYTNAAGRAPDYTELAAGSLGGLNLAPATYRWSSAVTVPSTLTLTGGPNDVWIFQIAQGLTVASGVKVILAGGALAQNIYWQVFSAADFGTTSAFQGTVISQTSIVLKTGASIHGKLLAGTAVTLDQNAVRP